MARIIKCKIDGCTGGGVKSNGSFPKGYCCRHYSIFMKHGDPLFIKEYPKKCKINDCPTIGNLSLGYCKKHYHRLIRHNTPLPDIRIHGEERVKNPLYTTYCSMKERCYNKNKKGFEYHGGRGIVVCDRWLGNNGFKNFCQDLGEKPSKKHSLDRIDNNGNYAPDNCRWANDHQQSGNRRNNNTTIGVNFDKSRGKWMSKITINKKVINFGRFDNYEDAVKARKDAENLYLKEGLIIL